MNGASFLQYLIFLLLVAALVKPMGSYMARVFRQEPTLLDGPLAPLERLIYRVCGIIPEEDMDCDVMPALS